MSKEDIDKLFESELGGAEAPIFESDWDAFSKQLPKKGIWYKRWFILLLAILLLGGTSAGLYFGFGSNISSQEGSVITEIEESKTRQRNSDVKATSKEEQESLTNSGQLSDQESTLNEKSPAGQSVASLASVEDSRDVKKPDSFVSAKKENQSKARFTETPTNVKQNQNIGAAVFADDKTEAQNPSDPTAAVDDSSPAAKSNEQGRINGAEQESSFSWEDEELSAFLESEDFAEVDFTLMPMKGIDTRIDQHVPALESEERVIENSRVKATSLFIFFRGSFDRVWGASPAIGLGVSHGMSRISMDAALGYFRSGTLDWTQTRREVTFGFDRYESIQTLSTERMDFIIVPINFAYRISGQSSVVLGLEGMMLVNAFQRLSQPEFREDTGYLLSTGTPAVLVNLRSAYRFDLNEYMNLDLGVQWSPQTWEAVDESPLGGFLQFNYLIK